MNEETAEDKSVLYLVTQVPIGPAEESVLQGYGLRPYESEYRMANLKKYPGLCVTRIAHTAPQYILSAAPLQFILDGKLYRRWLDRFYLPFDAPSGLIGAFFNWLAPSYEMSIDGSRNKALATHLLHEIKLLMPRASKACVLDFGCGTGIAAEGLLNHPELSEKISLWGVDMSPEMLQAMPPHRRELYKSLHIISESSINIGWRGKFDAILLVYVAHLINKEVYYRIMAHWLRHKGRVFFNLHSRGGVEPKGVLAQFHRSGFSLVRRYSVNLSSAGQQIPHTIYEMQLSDAKEYVGVPTSGRSKKP